MSWDLKIPISTVFIVCVACCVAIAEQPTPIDGPTKSTHHRPDWMKEGIVLAGNWPPLMQRKQLRPVPWTQLGFGLSDVEAEAAYRKETSDEMADRVKELGVTLVCLPLWHGASYESEFPGMEDTKRFAKVVHARGMKVGVYIHCGRLERSFLSERPEAVTWLAWPKSTSPPDVHRAFDATKMAPSYSVYRNHPGYQKFMRKLITYAINDVEADMLHFDNYCYPSGYSPWVMNDFRDYLRRKFTPLELAEYFGGEELLGVEELVGSGVVPVSVEWKEFQAWVLADSYRKLADYARSLRSDVAITLNTSGMGVRFRTANYGGGAVDLSQLLPHGDFFGDEQGHRGWDPDELRLETNIRTFKLARLFHQSVWTYTPRRLANCESLAFNYDCQSNLYYFFYGKLYWACTSKIEADDRLMPETRFYLKHRNLFNLGETLADVAVLRGRAVNLYGPEEAYSNAYLFEQAMITQHFPFEIIFDQHLNDLGKYRAVVLPDVRMMGDEQIEKVLEYVENGGGLVVTDQTASQDHWGRPRTNGLERFLHTTISDEGNTVERTGKGRVVYTRIQRPEEFTVGSLPRNEAQLADAVVDAMGGKPTFYTDAPPYVGMEFIEQDKRYIINLVDYSRAFNVEPDRQLRGTYFRGSYVPPRGTPQPGTATGAIKLWASARSGDVTTAKLLSPRQETIDIPVKLRGADIELTIPALDVYAVLIIRCQ